MIKVLNSFFVRKILLSICFFLFGFSIFSQGFIIPETPKIQTSVYDYENLLSSSQKSTLEQNLIRYSDSTSTQIVVAIIASTEGEEIKYLAAQWGEKWQIGQKGKDNGVFILLAKNDKKITIQVGRGAEPFLTDFMSKRIIERIIIPEFKKGDFYVGLEKGVHAIFRTLKGEFKETRSFKSNNSTDPGFVFFMIIIIILFIIIFRGNKNNRGGGRRTGSLADTIFTSIILSNSGRGSGSFGGGGASGGW
ncbi:TPM domain-containing protein [Polaribacter tangerinus]|uniref:TPM domain-containing protein n=1 Tax=Polaribacter tangerinus TaxID=1920034 RepID=UPI000B4A7488|nr:TPM domain-containing protein [Polaribacter tangerinus]